VVASEASGFFLPIRAGQNLCPPLLRSEMTPLNEPSSNNIVNLVANSFINYLDLKQCNNVINHRQDILDLIFSDCQINNIRKSLSLTPIFDAYHPPLELIYPLTSSPVTLVESLTPIMYNFNSCIL